MTAKTYDVKCYALAEHFLQDHPEINTVDRRKALAGEIQNAIESFILMEECLKAKNADDQKRGGKND
jgi:hypothetical protein